MGQAPGEQGTLGDCRNLAYTPWHLARACLRGSPLALDLRAPTIEDSFLMFPETFGPAAAQAFSARLPEPAAIFLCTFYPEYFLESILCTYWFTDRLPTVTGAPQGQVHLVHCCVPNTRWTLTHTLVWW